MSTIVNGRGIVKYEETKNEVMSIEEYRAIQFTPEQEWNNMHYPKRLSIETLECIEIRKRGKGDTKNVYTSLKEVDGKYSPYYDPSGTHIHIWKSHTTIPNLTGPQNANVPYIQFTDFKPGTYCCICHKLNRCHRFTWKQNIEYDDCSKLENNNVHIIPLSKEEYVTFDPIVEKPPEPVKKFSNWPKLMNKVFHTLRNDKVVYPVSKYKSLLMWPWEMTPYQKFKMSNPDYRKSKIFLESDLEKFQDNYAYIV